MSFLHRSHLILIREIWNGRSISQAVLAFLYSGLTAASTGQRPYGSMLVLSLWMDIHLRFRMGDALTDSRIFQTSTEFLFKTLIGLKTAYAPLAHLKTRADWRDFFKDMQSRHFLFIPCYMENKMVQVRLGRFVEHRLIGSTELVMYNAHRCFLQIGENRSKEFPGVSHLPPIVSRDLKDGAEALTALGLWMLSPVLKVQVKVEERTFDYVLRLQCLRS